MTPAGPGSLGVTSKAQYGRTPKSSSSPQGTQGYTRGLDFAAENFLRIRPHGMSQTPARAQKSPDWRCQICTAGGGTELGPRSGLFQGSSFCLEHFLHRPLPGYLLFRCQLKCHFLRGGSSLTVVPGQISLPSSPLALPASPSCPCFRTIWSRAFVSVLD